LQLEAAIEQDAVLRDLRDLAAEARGLEHLLDVGARSKADEQVAVAWTRLIFALGRTGRDRDALALRRVAEVAVARAGDTVDLRGRRFATIGSAYEPTDRAEAERWLRRGAALLESEPHHEEALAPVMNALGIVLMENHELAESVTTFEAARALLARAYGEENPSIQSVLGNEANVLLREGRYAEALPIYRRQLERCEQQHIAGAGLATPLHNVALAEFKLGRYSDAEAVLLRDLSVREAAFGADSPELIETLRLLGEGRALLGRFDESGAPLDRARAI